MPTIDLTQDTYTATVTAPGIVLVDFWASWCGPCRLFAPIFKRASETHPDITFAKVDTEAQPGLAADISAIPTLKAFRDGVLVYNQAGALPSAALERLIARIRETDPDDARPQLADRPSGVDA